MHFFLHRENLIDFNAIRVMFFGCCYIQLKWVIVVYFYIVRALQNSFIVQQLHYEAFELYNQDIFFKSKQQNVPKCVLM